MKISVYQKNIIKRVKRQITNWEKRFLPYITTKIFYICIPYLEYIRNSYKSIRKE